MMVCKLFIRGGICMRKRRSLCVSFIMLLIVSVLSACGDSENKSSGKSDDKVITYWNIGTEGADKASLQYAVDQFNENTESGYTVEVVAIQNDNYKEKLVVAMSSGEAPDMYTSWSGGPMNEYIDSGFAQPLDDLYDKYDLRDVYMDGALEQSTYNGKLYAVPTYNIAISGIFYNKEMFEEYDLEVPTTVSELEAVSDKLVGEGIIPFALANSSKWTGSMFFQNLAARKGGLEPFREAVEGEGSFEHESFKYAGEKIQEWVKKDYFPDGVNSLSEDDGQAKQLIYQEKAAMILIGSWYTGTFLADSPEFYEKMGWFPFPKVDDSDADPSIQIGTIGDQFISFNVEGEKLDAAFEMATYYSKPDSVEFMVEQGKIPPVVSINEYVKEGLIKEVLEAATDASAVQLWYDQYLPPKVAQAHLDSSQELFGLTMTPEQANEHFQKAMEEYLAEER